MSVLKSKRKPSQFEVFHHLNKLRRDITELLLRDFGYSFDKADKRLDKRFGGRAYDDLTETGRIIQKINPKRLTCMRRKMKKLAYILTPKEFEDWYQSWFSNYYKIMSKLQRQNMNTLFEELKEVNRNVYDHSQRWHQVEEFGAEWQ